MTTSSAAKIRVNVTPCLPSMVSPMLRAILGEIQALYVVNIVTLTLQLPSGLPVHNHGYSHSPTNLDDARIATLSEEVRPMIIGLANILETAIARSSDDGECHIAVRRRRHADDLRL